MYQHTRHSQKDAAVIQEQYCPIPVAKRLFDIVFATSFLILFLPIFLIFLPLIFIEHIITGSIRDPLFYTEKRVSQGKIFYLIKFNIFKHALIQKMRENEQFIHTKDLEHNGGITRIGWILKQIYMDELPQLFNVLKGEMSLVGPRPLNLEVYKQKNDAGIATQGFIRAGMTGNYQSMKSAHLHSQKDLDLTYYHYCTTNPGYKIVLFDIKILLRTIKVVLRARGI